MKPIKVFTWQPFLLLAECIVEFDEMNRKWQVLFVMNFALFFSACSSNEAENDENVEAVKASTETETVESEDDEKSIKL